MSNRGERDRPVVLVPGYRDNAIVFHQLVRHLVEEGFRIHPMSLEPSDGRVPLEELAGQVEAFVEGQFSPDQTLDFVGFSMGGIVLRYYLQRLQGLRRAERLVTLGSPHQGTWMAYGSRRPGVRQMRPGSRFLRDLARDADCLKQIHFTSIYTPLDLTIVPARSSVLPVARVERILVPLHRSLVTHGQALARVCQALRSQDPVSPTSDST